MIESQFITWEAPDGDHPVRRLSQQSYDLVSRKQKDGIAAFWDTAIAPVEEFRFTIRDSFANGNACANIGTFSTRMADGTLADTDLIATYRINDEGKIQHMCAHWEVDRTMATLRKADDAQ